MAFGIVKVPPGVTPARAHFVWIKAGTPREDERQQLPPRVTRGDADDQEAKRSREGSSRLPC